MTQLQPALAAAFPNSCFYVTLTDNVANGIRERPRDRWEFPYSERHLQCVWFDRRWRPTQLTTTAGEHIVVREPGRWNSEAGPDFLDAILEVGGRVLRGDVEVHIRASDWTQHAHADNPAYARVIAHVCYYGASNPASDLPPGAVQIALKEVLASETAFTFENIDMTAYPFGAPCMDSYACGVALKTWSPPERIQLLESAGEERLARKADAMRARISESGAEQAFYEEFMCALGYKHNRSAFLQLARYVPAVALRTFASGDATKAYALLLGVSGLMPVQLDPRWDDSARIFIRSVWDEWWRIRSAWEGKCMPVWLWKTGGMRPQNHPLRRLAAASTLFGAKTALHERIIKAADRGDADLTCRRLMNICSRATFEFWRRRFSLAGFEQDHDVSILGCGRIAAILSNVVVPFLAACGNDVSALAKVLPLEEENAIIRQAVFALFGRDGDPHLHATALRQQGLIQIFNDHCANVRNACDTCRLVAGLSASHPSVSRP